MKILDKHNARVEFPGEDEEKLTVYYDNRGGRRGYSQGATFELHDGTYRGGAYLTNRELRDLHKFLGELLAQGTL